MVTCLLCSGPVTPGRVVQDGRADHRAPGDVPIPLRDADEAVVEQGDGGVEQFLQLRGVVRGRCLVSSGAPRGISFGMSLGE